MGIYFHPCSVASGALSQLFQNSLLHCTKGLYFFILLYGIASTSTCETSPLVCLSLPRMSQVDWGDKRLYLLCLLDRNLFFHTNLTYWFPLIVVRFKDINTFSIWKQGFFSLAASHSWQFQNSAAIKNAELSVYSKNVYCRVLDSPWPPLPVSGWILKAGMALSLCIRPYLTFPLAPSSASTACTCNTKVPVGWFSSTRACSRYCWHWDAEEKETNKHEE